MGTYSALIPSPSALPPPMDDGISTPLNPVACSPVLVVAHTPGIPARYEVLLKNISCLLSWENQGKSYQCSLNHKNEFLRWSKAEKCLFFEWEEEEEQMVCWMHDIPGNSHMKFLVNPAIKYGINDVTVKHPALAFSSGFSDDSWAGVKDMLSKIFGSSEKDDSVEHDHLYVFTRIDSSFCIRNYKINAIPEGDNHDSPLVLTEVYPFCCFKLLDAQGFVNQVSDMSEIQLSWTVFYSVASDCTGYYTPHSLKLINGTYRILLKNDCNMSLVAEYDGFNLSLDHLLSKEPALKIKNIIGSRTNKESVFVRNRFKFIIRSTVLQLQHLFASDKCLELENKIDRPASNVLIRGTDVKFYGFNITRYTDKLAKQNLLWLVELIKACFPLNLIPDEVRVAIQRLSKSEKEHLNSLEELKNDPLWLRAEERRTLLITHHSEYMTNFDIKEEYAVDATAEADLADNIDFFDDCPYIDCWKQVAMDNEYLMDVSDMPVDAIGCNAGAATRGSVKGATKDDMPVDAIGGGAATIGSVKGATEDDMLEDVIGDIVEGANESDMVKDAIGSSVEGATKGRLEDPVTKRAQKKLKRNSRIKSVKRRQIRREGEHKGKIQFHGMRNFEMHMPERAKKDGIRPFRLGVSDYILTAYYQEYLGFIHRKMSLLLRKQKLKRKLTRKNN